MRYHVAMPRGRPKKIDRGGLAAWLFELADPTRLLILPALAVGEMGAAELARACGDESANVGHHLRRLKRATFDADGLSSCTCWLSKLAQHDRHFDPSAA